MATDTVLGTAGLALRSWCVPGIPGHEVRRGVAKHDHDLQQGFECYGVDLPQIEQVPYSVATTGLINDARNGLVEEVLYKC
jgi:hypothetical protein